MARLAASDANFLILDEPTNHLDLWARDSLEKALNRFDGTVLFVSHDRYFVNQVADHLLILEPGGFRIIEGNYDSFHLLSDHRNETPEDASDNSSTRSRGRGKNDASADNASQRGKSEEAPKTNTKKRRFPFRKVVDIEEEIFIRETRIEELQQQLSDPAVLRNGERSRAVAIELEQEQAALKTLYEHWEEASELNW